MAGKRKVILWGLGPVNRALAATILGRNDHEIIGALSFRPEDEGRDLGEYLDLQPANIPISTAESTRDADCIVLEPTQDSDQTTALILRLLADGKDVISTQAPPPSQMAAIQSACNQGKSTFHASSIFPQLLLERFALTLAKAIKKLEHIRVLQAVDCTAAPGELWAGIGLGRPKQELTDPAWLENHPLHHAMQASIRHVARQLHGSEPGQLRIGSEIETTAVARKQTIGDIALSKGDVVSLKITHKAWLNNALFLTSETHAYLGPENARLEGATPYGNVKTPYNFAVQVSGEPSRLDAQLEFDPIHPGSNSLAHVSAQGIRAAIAAVCEAEPGIVIHNAAPRYQPDERLAASQTIKKSVPHKEPYRIVIWGPGEIGGAVTRAALERRNIKIVGARVFSPHKDGKDLGELVGIAPISVRATHSTAAIKALRPDCVIMTPQPRAIVEGLDDDVLDLLESGINVITSAAYHNVTMPNWLAGAQTPMALLREVANTTGMAQSRREEIAFAINSRVMRAIGEGRLGKLITPAINTLLAPAVKKAMPFRATPQRLMAACQRGGSRLHGTGVHPSFMAERVGVQLAQLLDEPHHMRFIEAADFSYMPDGMWGGLGALGFGKPVEELDERYLIARAGDFYYGDVTGNIAHLLYGVPSTAVRVERSFRALPATRDFSVGSARIRKGSAAALHMVHKGYIGEHHFFTNEECWYLGPEREFRGEALPFGNFTTPISYTVEVSGQPAHLRMQLSMDSAGAAGQLFRQADTSTADSRCALGQRLRREGLTNPITNATAMALLDAVAPVCALPPGVIIDDISPGFLSY